MITKKCRPFWSYDVQKTEAWLTAMGKKGFACVNLNRVTRQFHFRQSEPRERTYRIGFDPMQSHALPRGLTEAGWNTVTQGSKWFIAVNDKPLDQIKCFPVRDGIVRRQMTRKFMFTCVLIYLFTMAAFQFILGAGIHLSVWPVRIAASPFWAVTIAAFIAELGLLILAIYSILILNKTIKRLTGERLLGRDAPDIAGATTRLRKAEEQKLKRSGQLILKWKWGWMYAPDRLEQWLEGMEARGYQLYRVNKAGTGFYFLHGNPRSISYCADYQHLPDESSYSIYRDAGWMKVFHSPFALQKWTLWSREYTSDEERPRLYSDKPHHLKHARRVALTYSGMFVPLIILYVILIQSNLQMMKQQELSLLQLTNMILFAAIALVYGALCTRTWLYYRRLNKAHLN